jgi:hypothetical protein
MHRGILSALAALIAAVTGASSAPAATIYALTDENDIITFDSASPNDLLSGGPITGILGQDFIGIDFRPTDGKLYGVTNLGEIWEINTTSFAGTFVSSMSVPLSGSRYGVDFDPSGLLHVVSDTDQNLTVTISTGATTVNGTLFYGPSQPGATGDNPSVTAAAYRGAVLAVLDVRDSEDRIASLNATTGELTVAAALGANVSAVNGFDIYHDGTDYIGVMALQQTVNGISEFLTINFTTSAATIVGEIGGGDLIDGIAVLVPEPSALAFLGIGLLPLMSRRRRR